MKNEELRIENLKLWLPRRAGACITRLPAQTALLLIPFAEVSTGHPRPRRNRFTVSTNGGGSTGRCLSSSRKINCFPTVFVIAF